MICFQNFKSGEFWASCQQPLINGRSWTETKYSQGEHFMKLKLTFKHSWLCRCGYHFKSVLYLKTFISWESISLAPITVMLNK
jgi:hypothetical protein